MGPERWNQIRVAFEAAKDCGAAERPALLDRLCGSDEALRAEVDDLLEAHDSAGRFIEQPVLPMAASLGRMALADSVHDRSTARESLIGCLVSERYRVEQFLGEGGFSMVFRASDGQLHGRHVVVKIPHLAGADAAWLEKRLWHEIEAMARIDHPGIVGLLDAGSMQDGRPFLVMRFVEGITVRDALRQGPMAPPRVVRLVSQIADALAFAHKRGVLHRDLKPENLMLQHPGGAEERAVIIDFGIATARDPAGTETLVTQVAGSQAYMAPEQLVGKPSVASDIYALGLTTYEMLAGMRRQAVPGGSAAGTPVADVEVEAVLNRATAYNPGDRYSSAPEFADALAAACVITAVLPPKHPPRRRWMVAAGITILAAATASALIPWHRPPAPIAPVKAGPAISYTLLRPDPADAASMGIAFVPEPGHPFQRGDRLRLRIVADRQGHLYVLNESEAQGAAAHHLLYPEPGPAGESASFTAGHELLIPRDRHHWMEFDEQPGTERVWIVWSERPVEALAPIVRAAFQNPRGEVAQAEQRRALTGFLHAARHSPELLVREIVLQHR